MELRYSVSGVPYIDFENVQLIFSESTKNHIGYKWFCLSGIHKVATGRNRRYSEIIPVTMVGVCKDSRKFFGKNFSAVKVLINKYVENDIFLYENINLLERDLNNGK
jgi:hypothetical protein